MKKIVLVHGRYFNSWEALGLGYIGAYLRRFASGIDLAYYQGCFDEDDAIIAAGEKADVVLFSCTSPTFPHAVTLAREMKKANSRLHTAAGGYHPSAVPQDCLVDGIDQVVVGEGETAALEIVQGRRDPIVSGRNLDFSELPFPDRALIRNERNIEVAFKDNAKRITSFQSHRACPFMCRFCADGFNKVLYGGRVKAPTRFRDAEDLLSEIEQAVDRYGLDLIKFSDPTWNIDIDWVTAFCRRKLARGVDVPFYPNIHATMCSREMVEAMAAAGCYEVAIGIESGSPRILKQVGKGTTTKTIRRAVSWFKEVGILVRGYFILGMPDETEEDLALTEAFADELGLDEYGFTILCPYPGTAMYDASRFADIDWERTDEYSNDFWHGRHLTNQELKAWQRRLTDRFASRLTWHNTAIKESCANG